jgi:hypothetical protein
MKLLDLDFDLKMKKKYEVCETELAFIDVRLLCPKGADSAFLQI